jgi:hypothetical protein
LALISTVFALGGCSAMPDFESFKAPDLSIMKPASTAQLRESVPLRPIVAEDLVDAEGRCSGVAPSAEPGAAPDAIPSIPAGIGLQMTECDVVKRAGTPERVQIGTNEASERTATLTYIRGSRPGIYTFVSGRLKEMDRAPEPAPSAKPSRTKPKPRTRAAT